MDGKAATHGALGYEGPEKTLEVSFVPDEGHGLHAVRQAQWETVLEHARCRILSESRSAAVVAFVLSESSLFVYPWKLFLKTCGTTTLLACLPSLFEITTALGMRLDWLRFSRKNFTFPSDQTYPHTSFPEEIAFCMDKVVRDSMSGLAQVLGDADNWNVLMVSSPELMRAPPDEAVLNVMMYDMAPDVLAIFAPRPGEDERQAAARAIDEARLTAVLPGHAFDAWMFRPCGFSLNALCGDAFATIHVTPEPAFSYASFETNARFGDALLHNLTRVFKPTRLTVTVFAGCEPLCAALPGYRLLNQHSTLFQNNIRASLANFSTA